MNIPDYDAPTQMVKPKERNTKYVNAVMTIPQVFFLLRDEAALYNEKQMPLNGPSDSYYCKIKSFEVRAVPSGSCLSLSITKRLLMNVAFTHVVLTM